jgi:Xaa-Pro aminopeptidase
MTALSTATLDRLRHHMEQAGLDVVILGTPENVGYATGYRSVAGDIFRSHRMAAVVTATDIRIAAPAADAGALSEITARHEPFGTFFFEATDPTHPAHATPRHGDFAAALAAATTGVGGVVGVDDAIGESDLARLAMPAVTRIGPCGQWLSELRSVKLPEEVSRLAIAARLAADAIQAAVDAAAVGVTERELATLITVSMSRGGGMPRFVVVTSGERSALSDGRPTDRPLRPGDLVRFDVGCTYDGYWSDIGRTAVVGEPSDLQASRYRAILAGETAQLEVVRAGITGKELFDAAVDAVEAAGLAPYRRHHCGHGIGTSVYEPPSVSPMGADAVLREGMVLCVETPFYQIGWGGMMVEDCFMVTAQGYQLLTSTDRHMRVIPT